MKQRSLKMALAALWAGIVIFLVAFGLKLLNDFVLVPGQAGTLRVPTITEKPAEREIRIFFADQDAEKLTPEKRLVRLGAGTAADARTIIGELIKGPQSADLYATIPTDTRLLNAYALRDIMVLDFSREIQKNHIGGSTGEMLTVFSIVNTIAINIDGIRKIQVLVEGEEIETLAGHIDLTKPLSPNTAWSPA